MDVLKLLNELEGLIENRTVFLGITPNFHQDEFLDLTNKIRASLPDEMKRANRVTAESDKIVDGARMTAEQTLEDASAEADQITRDARANAERLLREAEAHSNKMTQMAESSAKQLVTEAQQKAETMLRDAHQQSEALVSQNEVVRLATAQAREIISVAEREAREVVNSAEIEGREMRQGADEYAQGMLIELEQHVGELLTTAQRGRAKLDQRVASHKNIAPSTKSGWNNPDLAGTRR